VKPRDRLTRGGVALPHINSVGEPDVVFRADQGVMAGDGSAYWACSRSLTRANVSRETLPAA
jgi:hypothetical protein